MFDLTDYVFKNEKERIGFADTPLGKRLLERGIMGEQELETRLNQLKENPLVYLDQPGGGLKLVNIISEGRTKKDSIFIENDLTECSRVIQEINWEKSRHI
jgi:glycerate-2-kinase